MFKRAFQGEGSSRLFAISGGVGAQTGRAGTQVQIPGNQVPEEGSESEEGWQQIPLYISKYFFLWGFQEDTVRCPFISEDRKEKNDN